MDLKVRRLTQTLLNVRCQQGLFIRVSSKLFCLNERKGYHTADSKPHFFRRLAFMHSRLYLSVFRPTTILMLVIVGLCVFIGQQAVAMATCPFCSAVALTFSEQIEQQEVAVVAKLVEKPQLPETDTFDFPDGKFEIVGVLKGKKIVNTGMTFKTQVVGVYPVGQKFLIMGQGAPDIAWTTPIKTTERVFEYLQKIRELPASGPERLAFFQQYFEDKEKILAFDAFDEFAAAPYEDLLKLKDQMQREKLLEFIKSPKTTINRRRLYFTMLGVCGKPEDAKMLEGLIRSDSRKQQAGLDALVGCYLTLVGKKGLPLIEERFLTNEKADYVDLTNVMDALRFHATETDIISTADIVPAVRTILDHPDHADIVIEDLARWGDWTVVDKLAKRFKELDEDDNWQRVPIAAYLLACPTEAATKHIEELEKIEPEAFAKASYLHNLGNVDSDDDWDNDEFPVAGGVEDSADQEPEAEDDAAPKAKTKPIPTESTTIQDPKVHAALAEVPWEEVDGENTRVKVALVGEAQFIANSTDPVEAQLANVYINAPEANANSSVVPAEATTESTKEESQPITAASPNKQQSAQVAAASAARLTAKADSARSNTSVSLILKAIFIPMAASVLILGLMWSVVNGWFERLIF